ncbi:ferritin-like domain-containing protein [Crepidotus variabilis]|uniref:Ferritin-like domain-containing protein n=1 Tax=Crepidotus variabilis TaxID=179855 RepID=A0A9P6EGV3_9AGAR|nr:ferritin-like domain-containing protein [Crepidotus variabilis]
MFRSLYVAVVAALSLSAAAAPLQSRNNGVDDVTILNYALTLEHLENAFYHEALSKFDEKAFTDAGLPDSARGRFNEIASHEQTHVDFLSKALGDKATQPCTYSFPYTDPKSFVALSQVLEGVGTSAYAGAAKFISNKDYLTAAATILTTEARHAGFVSSAINKFAAWGGAFDTPLGFNEVYTLAAPFITSCPDSNPKLPVTAFPDLTVANAAPGQAAAVTSKADKAASHIAFFSGLDQIFVPINNGQVMIPQGLKGQIYAVATTSATAATDDVIVAGPAILLYEYDYQGNLMQ